MTDCHQENSQWSIKLLQTLNTVAIALQSSGRTVDDIFRIFKEQLAAVNMGGAIILLDDPDHFDEPDATATVFANTISNATIRKLEKRLNLSASHLTFKLSQATVMQKVIRTGEAQFIADSQPLLAQYLPPKAQPYAKLITRPFKNIPSIDAPIYQKERIIGMLAFTTPGLAPADIPAIEAFAHHIGIALENTNLIQSLQTEIEHHKKTEARLQENKTLYQTLVASTLVAIIIHADYKFEFLNPAAVELLGGQSELDFLGRSIFEFTTAEYYAITRQRVAKLYQDRQTIRKVENQLLKLDKTPIMVELVSSPISFGGKPAALVILQDITKQKKSLAQLEERLAQLALLNDISHEIAGMLKLSDVFDSAVTLIHNKFRYHHVAMFTRDEAQQTMVMMARAGAYAALLPAHHTLKFTEGMVGWVTRHKQTLVANDVAAEPIHHNPMPEHPQMVTRAELSIPVVVDGVVEAVLDIQSPKLNAFGDSQVMVLETLTQQISVAIKNARYLETIENDLEKRRRTEETLRLKNQELSLLNQVISISASSVNLTEALETISREFSAAIGTNWSGVVIVDSDEHTGTLIASHSDDTATDFSPVPPGLMFPLVRDFFEAIHASPAIAVADISQYPLLSELFPDLNLENWHASFLAVPIKTSEKLVGLLATGTPEPHQYSDADIALAHRVSEQLSGIIVRIELEKTRRKLSMAVEQSTDAVVIVTADGEIEYVNRGFERMFGYRVIEVLHTIPRSLAPEDELAPLDEAVAEKKHWGGRINYFHKDGSLINTETTITPIRTAEGQVVNFVIIAQDISQRMALEDQLRQSQKMEAVGQLAAGIAHDFNNMLTAVNGFAELLLEKTAFNTPQHEYVLQILESGNRAADLVRQLLAFSRKQLIAPKILNLNQTILDVQYMLRRVIGEHIEIKTNLEANIYPVKLDPAQIEQILINLAVNAQDAMPQGGTLTIETANVLLSTEYTGRVPNLPPGQYVLLTVSDTGEGIPADILNNIFEPFFTTKEVGKGTGLGLATIYGIVKQNEGHIEVRSELEVGTTFFIYLPRTHEVFTAPPMNNDHGLPVGAGTVVVVEDSEFVLDFAETVLSELGYSVIGMLNAQSALDRYESLESPPDLLLTDLVLPGIDGLQLASITKKRYPHIKILYMSGYKETDLHNELPLTNGAAYLPKPFTAADLAKTVQSLLTEQ